MAKKEHEVELKLLAEEEKRAKIRAREAAAEEEQRLARIEHQRQATEALIRVSRASCHAIEHPCVAITLQT